MKIGTVIRTLRQEKGATLEKLALEIGTDAGNLSRIERNRQQVSAELLQAISQALGTTVAALYAAAEPQPVLFLNPPPELRDISPPEYTDPVAVLMRRTFRELNPTNKQLAIEFLRLLIRMQNAGTAETSH